MFLKIFNIATGEKYRNEHKCTNESNELIERPRTKRSSRNLTQTLLIPKTIGTSLLWEVTVPFIT